MKFYYQKSRKKRRKEIKEELRDLQFLKPRYPPTPKKSRAKDMDSPLRKYRGHRVHRAQYTKKFASKTRMTKLASPVNPRTKLKKKDFLAFGRSVDQPITHYVNQPLYRSTSTDRMIRRSKSSLLTPQSRCKSVGKKK